MTGGLHGVGVSVVNALSEWCEVEVHREERSTDSATAGAFPSTTSRSSARPTGRARPPRLWPTPRSLRRCISMRRRSPRAFRELAFLNRGILIIFRDERTGKETRYQYDGGIVSFVEHINKLKDPLHDQ